MRDQIIERLRKIELENKVVILYACESGSRAWGFPSADSDYDIRFIYVHPRDWYLTIQDKRDVLEFPLVQSFDFSGRDIRKALGLFRRSNPHFWSGWVHQLCIRKKAVLPATCVTFQNNTIPLHHASTTTCTWRRGITGIMSEAKISGLRNIFIFCVQFSQLNGLSRKWCCPYRILNAARRHCT